MLKPVARIAIMVVVLFGASSHALADWVIARVTGTVVLVSPDAVSTAATDGQLLPNGWGIVTAADGRAMLTREGGEAITVSPNSQIVVTEDGPSTQVLQPMGVVEYDVEPRDVRHFAVETPILAAVVKGTRFVVSVGADAGSVAVERGAVEVTAFGSGQVGTFLAGQTATLSGPNSGLDFSGEGAAPAIIQGEPRSPLVMPSSASLSLILPPAGVGVAAGSGQSSVDVGVTPQAVGVEVGVGPVVGTVAVQIAPDALAVDLGVGVGPVDLNVGAGVDLTPDEVGVDLDVGVGPVDLDVGVTLDLSPDELGVELDLADADIDVDLAPVVGDTVGGAEEVVGGAVGAVGGLLGGLFGGY